VRLCVTARRAEALDALRAQLVADGAECIAVPGDVVEGEDVGRVVARCVQHYGRVDLLVNNAAVQVYAPFEVYEWDEITRVFDVTCLGYLRIINVASMLSAGAAPLLSV
jgi:NADP-dependent 3-hydroxy acid dehydrogenase YdfG